MNNKQQNINESQNRGNSYYENHQYKLAIAEYSQTIKLDPDNADVYRDRGNAYYNLKQ